MPHDVVIIGAGQAGLATAFHLQRAGVTPLIIDDQPGPGAAWRHAWPSLTLFSTAQFSNLPGKPMPSYPGFPPAQHVIDYFAEYEQRYNFTIKRPARVRRVDIGADGGFELSLADEDEPIRARHVVAATGTFQAPFVPSLKGTFAGTQWHSSQYPGPEPFYGASVAVVGAGNSGAQIATELTLDSRVGEVTWLTKEEPRWMPDDIDGRELFHRATRRVQSIRRGDGDPGKISELGDIIVLTQIKQARDSGVLKATAMVDSLDDIQADHLIWCTGFRPAVGPVRHLIKDGATTVDKLHLVGYGDWTGPGSATIIGVAPYAKETAARIAQALQSS